MLRLAVRSLVLAAAGWLLLGAAGALVLAGQHARLLSVQTASMVPAFGPGDALLVRPAAVRQLHPGDVVSYRSLVDNRLIISHRLIRIDTPSGRLTTAGDALSTPDPPISPDRLVGRVTAVAPGLGRLVDAWRRPLGLVLFVYLPAIITIAAELLRLARAYAHPLYSARLEP